MQYLYKDGKQISSVENRTLEQAKEMRITYLKEATQNYIENQRIIADIKQHDLENIATGADTSKQQANINIILNAKNLYAISKAKVEDCTTCVEVDKVDF